MAELHRDELDTWTLARSRVIATHEMWMPDNTMPIEDALRMPPNGDFIVGIPLATKTERWFAQQYGLLVVPETTFQTTLPVDGNDSPKTNGTFCPEPSRQGQKR